MRKTVTALCSLMLLLPTAFSSLANAQNRQAGDAIFNEPRGNGYVQLLLTLGDIIAFQVVRPKLPAATKITEAEARVMRIMQSDATEATKISALREAETDLAKARLAALQSLEGGVIPTVVKYARIVGTTLVLVDLAERAWVWGALNANPTWSPAITTLLHNGEKLSRQYALPER